MEELENKIKNIETNLEIILKYLEKEQGFGKPSSKKQNYKTLEKPMPNISEVICEGFGFDLNKLT